MSAEEEQHAAACDSLKSLIYVSAASSSSSSSGGATAAAPSLRVLDQLLLPTQKVYLDVSNVADAWQVIHTMQIRGAPLIAIVAVLGLAVDLSSYEPTRRDMEKMMQVHEADRLSGPLMAYIQGKMDYLATSRPTAVNLFNALQEVKAVVTEAAASASQGQTAGDPSSSSMSSTTSEAVRDRMVAAVVRHAEFMLQRDEADCRAIGKYGAEAILTNVKDDDNEKVTIMTIWPRPLTEPPWAWSDQSTNLVG
jgi:methylthioribose-1-phosphate isomerase